WPISSRTAAPTPMDITFQSARQLLKFITAPCVISIMHYGDANASANDRINVGTTSVWSPGTKR
ncbi:MAG: hypothetical protein J2P56_10245, partial [Verrucomicrobia bacterium]|nr:hypothetical protein [Verrucomicrobiota bacterium]